MESTHNPQRAIDEIASANGVSNKVTHVVYSHHHADHVGASFLFGRDVERIGHTENRRLLLHDNDPTRPVPDTMFENRLTLRIGGGAHRSGVLRHEPHPGQHLRRCCRAPQAGRSSMPRGGCSG